ncbi:MAG: 4-hydroxythreonine-4-phosphate dehydrogenase PdxA, partial [Alteromonadaceae bacterium]
MEAPRIMITAGEPAGIGPDVILNALHSNFEACITVVGDINVLQQRVTALNLDTRI